MGVALYRKYRSTGLDEVVGQDHIVQIVQNMMGGEQIPHAFLLTGPRGVGKTTIARLMAVLANNIAYDALESKIDIVEIDAASNRRIDEIRDLKEQVAIMPTELRYKVYIIDEVHMLTKEAFNALLKTLEEPPGHVLFILATTELHKLPVTIISRCLRFNFRSIPEDLVVTHLQEICSKEQIKVETTALTSIAHHSGGSFRDALSILENFRYLGREITLQDVYDYLGLPSGELVENIISSVKNGDVTALYAQLDTADKQGVNYQVLARDISQKYRDILQKADKANVREIIELLDGLLLVQSSQEPKQQLLVTLLKAMPYVAPVRERPVITQEQIAVAAPEESTALLEATEVTPELLPQDVLKANEETPPIASKVVDTSVHVKAASEDVNHAWEKTLELLKKDHNTLYAIAKTGTVASYVAGEVRVEVTFPFHAKRLNDEKNKRAVTDVFNSCFSGDNTVVIFDVKNKKPAPAAITNISNIFGDIEVLE